MARETKGYPKRWSEYTNSVTHVSPIDFGFIDSQGDINRFAARFRAANKFKGIVLEGYSADTVDGYSALCQVMFAWSAFETFEKIIGLNRQEMGKELESCRAIEILNRIRAIDTENRFYKFIYDRVNNKHKSELDNYFNEDPCNIAYLASAIRHIFAHGWLSPHANQANPEAVTQICNILSQFLLDFMDKEFSKRVEQFFDWFHGAQQMIE